jgi:hypothetical protein
MKKILDEKNERNIVQYCTHVLLVLDVGDDFDADPNSDQPTA